MRCRELGRVRRATWAKEVGVRMMLCGLLLIERPRVQKMHRKGAFQHPGLAMVLGRVAAGVRWSNHVPAVPQALHKNGAYLTVAADPLPGTSLELNHVTLRMTSDSADPAAAGFHPSPRNCTVR